MTWTPHKFLKKVRDCFAWPGGYTFVWRINDDILCWRCMRKEAALHYNTLLGQHFGDFDFSMHIGVIRIGVIRIGVMVSNGIDPGDEFCSECGKDVSAYVTEEEGGVG